MKVAIIGATGFVGPKVVNEALSRGHEVTAFSRDPSKLDVEPEHLIKQSVDVYDTDILAQLLVGFDAVISTFNAGWTNPNLYDDFLKGSRSIQEAAKKAGVKRFITVGGAGSLYIHGQQLVDSPQFPADWKAGATAARDYLTELRNEQELDWTFVSPAINLHPGTRTGVFRLGTEEPVFNAEGKSDISAEDLAVALIDELEKGQFIKQRFTLGY
ncbi:NAD(P)-dependent oxidoreductase [Mucilaginibacter daejeonensis]|uniref:NAD(P)-dependent oxidoreductase n=1 Tax=Mucilaginibacter daejeonensis TaxID=398049 RepID=UPI001D170C2A|nr:NAD(P)-dependent oxidoreductase [Mucilaginibacter daejeonensis]UEG51741.1 NAD(P)-dependent oxidoreductase [Mucilaginibacter daejeonensis]